MKSIKVKVIKTIAKAELPEYQTDGAAAVDLHVYPDGGRKVLPNGQTMTFRTGLKMHIEDPNIVGIIVPRSGLGIKEGIVLANGTGVIDSDYQGEIQIGLRNTGSVSRFIEEGERVAQMLFMPVFRVKFEAAESFEEETERGEEGIGSTGTKKKKKVAA